MELDDLWSAAVTGDQNYYKEVVEPHRNRIRSSFYAHTHSSSHHSNNQLSPSDLRPDHAWPDKDRTSCTISTVSLRGGGDGSDEHTSQKDYYLDEHRPRIYSGQSYEESLFDEQNKLRAKDVLPFSEKHQGEHKRREMDWEQEQKSPEHAERQKKLSSNSSLKNRTREDRSPCNQRSNEGSHRNPASPDSQVKRNQSDDSNRSRANESGRTQVNDSRERTRRTSHRSQKQMEELDKRINRLVSECLHMGSPSKDEDERIKDDDNEMCDSKEGIRIRNIKTEEGSSKSEQNDRFWGDREGMRHEGMRYESERGSQSYRDEAGRERRSSVHWNHEVERSLEREREREKHGRDHGEHDESSQGSTQRSESSSSSDGGGFRLDERGELRVRRAEYGGSRIRNTMSDCQTERRWVDRGLSPGLSSDIGRKRCFSEGYKHPLSGQNKDNGESTKTKQSEEDSKRFRDRYRQSSQGEPHRSPNLSGTTSTPAKTEAPRSVGEKKTKEDIKQMLIEAGNQSVQNYRNMVEQGRFIARTYVKPPDVQPVMRYTYTVSYPINYTNVMQPQSLSAGKSKSSKDPKKNSDGVSDEKRRSPSVGTIDISSSEDDDDDDTDDDAIIVSTSSTEGAAGNPIVL